MVTQVIPNMATLDRFVRLFDELKGKSPNSDIYQLGKFVYDHLVSTGNIQDTRYGNDKI